MSLRPNGSLARSTWMAKYTIDLYSIHISSIDVQRLEGLEGVVGTNRPYAVRDSASVEGPRHSPRETAEPPVGHARGVRAAPRVAVQEVWKASPSSTAEEPTRDASDRRARG